MRSCNCACMYFDILLRLRKLYNQTLKKPFGVRVIGNRLRQQLIHLNMEHVDFPSTYVESFHDLNKVKKLKYVDFGSTGLKVSHLGFGAGCFGNHYGDYDLAEAKLAVQEALKAGINYIDTAPYYGEGKSEETLGKILKGIPRSAYYIATKVARYNQDPRNGFDFSKKSVLDSVNRSLQRLGLEYVDLIQIHDIEFATSVDVIVDETLPALEEIVKAGKARFIGVTGYPLNRIWQVVEKSRTKIDAVLTYCRLTLMDDSLNEYIPKFKSKGLAILHASPPAMGLLTNRGPWPWHPGNLIYKETCAKTRKFCQEQNVELGKLAVYHTVTQPDVDVHLIGMPDQNFVKMNLDIAINGISEREEQILKEIFQRFFKPENKYHWENIELNKYKEERLNLGLE